MELLSSKNLTKNSSKDFPGDSVVKNPPANARETGSIPAPEDSTSHGAILWNVHLCHNYWAGAPEPMLCNKRSHCKEKPTHHN